MRGIGEVGDRVTRPAAAEHVVDAEAGRVRDVGGHVHRHGVVVVDGVADARRRRCRHGVGSLLRRLDVGARRGGRRWRRGGRRRWSGAGRGEWRLRGGRCRSRCRGRPGCSRGRPRRRGAGRPGRCRRARRTGRRRWRHDRAGRQRDGEVRRGRRRRRHDSVGRCGRCEAGGDDADRNRRNGEQAPPSRRRVSGHVRHVRPPASAPPSFVRNPAAPSAIASLAPLERPGGELPAPTEPGPVTVWSRRRGRLDLPSHKAPAPVAQWIEHLTTDQKVGSSTLSGRARATWGFT